MGEAKRSNRVLAFLPGMADGPATLAALGTRERAGAGTSAASHRNQEPSGMITVYYKSGTAQWKYELDDAEHDYIIKNVLEDNPDLDEMFDDSLDILRDVSEMADDEMEEDDEIDQTIAVSFLWHYFNNLAEEDERINGDIVIVEDEDGTGVTVLPATDLTEE
jgi:hypothetical protein